MKIEVGGRPRLLTYCTNVHPAETVAGIQAALDEVSVAVKEEVCPDEPFGLGLWLPRGALDELTEGHRLAEFRAWLESRGLYVFTLNAFPYSGFHQARVKERVFQPQWDEDLRREYTIDCAVALAALLPDGVSGSISTSPLGLPDPEFDRNSAIENLHRVGDRLAQIEAETGRRIVLAIEPEPCAILGTVACAARFLDEEVFKSAGDPRRRHLGVCVDACHEAVLFQDPGEALSALRRREVACGKLQVTSAVRILAPATDRAALARIRAFDEGRYFHQVAHRQASGDVVVTGDLAPFLRAIEAGDVAGAEEARVHFHVPVFSDPEGPVGTTRAHLERLLESVAIDGLVSHLEVETYTFDVIPEGERASLGGADLARLLAREIEWTRAALGAP